MVSRAQRDVMARSVVVLREVERVGDLVAVLKRTRHNGFPIVDVGKHQRCTFFAGLLLRRQLLVLLRERVWELQGTGERMPPEARRRFVDSAFASASKVLSMKMLSPEDCDARIDLRPFMDPSPYVVNELMPLRRVYRFFNEIGVRHLTVIDCREQVVGIITRKDIQPEAIEQRILGEQNLAEVKQLLQRNQSAERARGQRGSVLRSLMASTLMPLSPKPSQSARPAAAGTSFAPVPVPVALDHSWEDSRCQTRRQAADSRSVRIRIHNGLLNSRARRPGSPSSVPSSPGRHAEVSMESSSELSSPEHQHVRLSSLPSSVNTSVQSSCCPSRRTSHLSR